jgi:hypothetical protein
LDALPILLGFPDGQIFKLDRPRLVDVVVNGGLHVHALLILPRVSRLRESAAEHFRQNEAVYVNERSRLQRVHVTPIVADSDFVTDYAMKSLKARRFDGDEIIVLPHSFSELNYR